NLILDIFTTTISESLSGTELHILYQYDTICRVIARLIKERDAIRE
ncbi:20475_t:CDS:1, partial [Gigaspora margarita]